MHDNHHTSSFVAVAPEIIVFRDERGWNAARRAAKLADHQQPAAIALPRTTNEMVAIADYATILGLRLAISGADSSSTPDESLAASILVDTSSMVWPRDALPPRTDAYCLLTTSPTRMTPGVTTFALTPRRRSARPGG